MLATLYMVFLISTPFGDLPFEQRMPFPSVAACEAWWADPSPAYANAGPFPVKLVHSACLDEPTDPGKPV